MPVIGEPADLLNASIYLAEGNYLDASLSAAGAIPFAGWAASGAQIVKNTYRAGNAAMEVADTVSDGIRLADNAPLTAATPPASTITTFDPVPPMVKMPDTPIAVPKTPDVMPPLRQAETPGTVADLTPSQINTKLQDYKDAYVAKYESGEISMSAKQADAAAINPKLEPAFRGQVIDADLKSAVRADPELGQLYVTRSGEVGPDFYDPVSETWWDATTEAQWDSHVDRYADPYGAGVPLITDV